MQAAGICESGRGDYKTAHIAGYIAKISHGKLAR